MDVDARSVVVEGRASSIGIPVVVRNVGLQYATFVTGYVQSSNDFF